MFKEALRPVWAEINLNNLEYNIDRIKEIASEIGIEGEEETKELLKEGTWLVKSKILCNKNNLSTYQIIIITI